MDYNKKQFARYFKKLRKISGGSRYSVSLASGLSFNKVNSIEFGLAELNKETFEKLGSAFDVPAKTLEILAMEPKNSELKNLVNSLSKLIISLHEAKNSTRLE